MRVITVALCGFAVRYAELIQTHLAYCDRLGYEHRVVTEHRRSNRETAAWLKIELLLESLEIGIPTLVLDADTEISVDAPRIESVEVDGKCVYMALGHSGRFNSGVIYALPHPGAIDLISKILRSRGMPVSQEDDVVWGENGHVIQYAKNSPIVQCLEQRWNNTIDPDLRDYIRHYTGPMKSWKQFTLL